MKKYFNYILILGFIGVISCDKENKTAIEKEVKIIKTIDANRVSKTDSIILENTNLEGKISKTENKPKLRSRNFSRQVYGIIPNSGEPFSSFFCKSNF